MIFSSRIYGVGGWEGRVTCSGTLEKAQTKLIYLEPVVQGRIPYTVDNSQSSGYNQFSKWSGIYQLYKG